MYNLFAKQEHLILKKGGVIRTIELSLWPPAQLPVIFYHFFNQIVPLENPVKTFTGNTNLLTDGDGEILIKAGKNGKVSITFFRFLIFKKIRFPLFPKLVI